MKAPLWRVKARIARTRRIIRVWNTAPSATQAARRLGMKLGALTTIVANFRLRGLLMQMFHHSTRQPELDWGAMARYAERFRSVDTR